MLLLRMEEAFGGGSSCSPLAYRADSLASSHHHSHLDEPDEECYRSTVATPRLSVDQDIDCIIDVEGTDDEDMDEELAAPTAASGRRIYPTQFKLHVLDSYRRDSECRGNQRATARKFGIHRRQIQKWLQGEKILRASLNNNEPEEPDDEELEEDDPEPMDLCVKRLEERLDGPAPSGGSASPSPVAVAGGKRRSFTLQFKLDVLDAFYSNAACKGNQRATARLFGINRRQVQKWLCQEHQLRNEAALGADAGAAEAKRQRLGRWLWASAQAHVHTPAQWQPPQDTALCLVKRPPPPSSDTPSESSTESTEPLERPKRHSYPLDFKLQALDAYHNDTECCGNQRAVAKRFAIHRRQVQKWLKQEQQLRQRRQTHSPLGLVPPLGVAAALPSGALKRPFAFKPLVPVQVLASHSWHVATSVESRPVCW